MTGAVEVERDLLESPPVPESEIRTTTYLLSASRELTNRWDVMAEYKREVADKDADNIRDNVLGELGWQVGRFLKFSGGYQYINFDDNQNPDDAYTAYSAYVKLIGKL